MCHLEAVRATRKRPALVVGAARPVGKRGVGQCSHVYQSQDGEDIRLLENVGPQTAASKVCVSHVLQCASVTLGSTSGVCPSTNCVRKSFTRLVASGNNVDSITRD